MLTPLSKTEWNRAKAGYLLRRAAMGASPATVETLYQAGMTKAVDSLIQGEEDAARFPVPDWVDAEALTEERKLLRQARRTAGQDQSMREHRRVERQRLLAMREQWLTRMRYSSHPLRETMTLFWHGHFATSVQKVKDVHAMWLQNALFRQHALGSFPVLLKQLLRDPAMIRWLDIGSSKKGKPNENFARELLELFTLGEGNYSEQDIGELARAITGYRFNGLTMEPQFALRQHDQESKTLFGKTDTFTGDSAIDWILSQPAASLFLATKIVHYFVTDTPSPSVIAGVSTSLRKNNWSLSPVLRELFLSEAFYAEGSRPQIKSPVQLVIHFSKGFDCNLPPARLLDLNLRQLGQDLFAPPNVKGWDGGRSWITSATLIQRYNLTSALLGFRSPGIAPVREVVIDWDRVAPPALRTNPESLLNALQNRLLAVQLQESRRREIFDYMAQNQPLDTDKVREVARRLTNTPEYQLL